jgi:hypothetical protein
MTAEVKTTPKIAKKDWQTLEKLYTIREPEKVQQYLGENPYLLPLLFEAPDHIHRYFPNVPLFLNYVPDPEIAEYNSLIVGYRFNYQAVDPEDYIDKDSQFWRDWGFKAIDRLPKEYRSRLFFMMDIFAE